MNLQATQQFGWKRFARFVVLSLWIAALATANSAAGATPATGTEVTRKTLPNGLQVIIVPNPLAPVVTTVVNYLVGSAEAPAGFPGMAHAQEHMMFRGVPGLTADQLSAISAAMGGNFDADTQQTVTQYFFTVPSEELDVALHIESLRMKGVLDSDALWDKERGAIEQEVAQDLSNPTYVFYTKLLSTLFHGTVYDHDALGTKDSFDKTSGTMLHNFYNSWYAPNNAILVIAGDVDAQKVMPQIEKLFGDIPKKNLPERPAVQLGAVSTETVKLDTDLPYGLAVVSFRVAGYDSNDFAALQVLSDVVASQRGTLYQLVPDGKALDAGFSLSLLPKGGVAFAMAAFPQGADGNTLIGEMRKILADDLKNGVPADLVEAAKRHELASEEFQKNSIEGLAMEWSNAVAVEGRQSPEEDVAAIQKVTAEQVNQVAHKYLDWDKAYIALLTPQESGKPISSKSFGAAESLAGTPSGPVTLPDWATEALNRLSVPKLTKNPEVSTLSNGIKLIVQKETISDSVTVVGHIKNNADLQAPKGQSGVESVLNDLFSYGSSSLDRIAFQTALDDIGADESAGTDFSVAVLTSHFDRGVALLADNLLHPALPENAFKVVQTQTAQALAGELQSPHYRASYALKEALFPKSDPVLRQATPQTVSSLNLPDLQDYYGRVFRPDMTTIVVIGNITPDQAKTVVEKYFGGWTATGPKPDTDLPAAPNNSPGSTVVPDKSRVQVDVNLAETLKLTRFDPDYYALELGNHVLGGGFYATRLYRDLRENAGLVYFVSSSFEIGKTRGIYRVNYACDPQNVSKARAIVVRDLNDMQKTPASADDLRQAKAMLLRQVPLSEASVDRIAEGWIGRAAIGLPLDEPYVAAQRYVGLTAEQVQAAFAKWLRPNDLVEVTQGPNPQ
ncbi:MAG TPA: pitrilysin family protein [Candidatus Sulfotelmatobacter sp.]|nr:pitrilysin family protein [Candidatus Sulfotelmatobacter sp.]